MLFMGKKEMNKVKICICVIVMATCLAACSKSAPKVKCGVYRSETSDAYIEIFEGEMLIIHNFDLSGFEKILEDETISFAKLNESEAEALRESWDLNRDYADKKVKFEIDDSWYKYEGVIDIGFMLDNPYDAGCVSWGLAYFPASEKIILDVDSFVSDEHVSEIFVLEK